MSRGLRACDIDGLPTVQKQAAQFMIRMPHVSANVLLRRMGGYEYPTNLDDAGLIHMYGMYCKHRPVVAGVHGRGD